jgi:hypothetical protein
MSYVHGLGDAQEAASKRFDEKYGWLSQHPLECPNCNEAGIIPYDHRFEGDYDDDFPDCILMYNCDYCGHEYEEYQ